MLIAVAACALVMSAAADDVWDWVEEVAPKAWASVTESSEQAPFEAGDVRWAARVEASDGWGQTGLLRVWVPLRGRPQASFVRFLGESLQGQLAELRRREPSIESARALAAIRMRRGEHVACGALDEVVKQLPAITLLALPDVGLAFHAPGFVVRLEPAFGEAREYSLLEDENDLARWSAEAMKAAASCTAG